MKRILLDALPWRSVADFHEAAAQRRRET